MTDKLESRKAAARQWFEKLRDQLVLSLEKIEMNKFTRRGRARCLYGRGHREAAAWGLRHNMPGVVGSYDSSQLCKVVHLYCIPFSH